MSGKRHNAHFRHMLVGYDGSPQSEKAVEVAFSPADCVGLTAELDHYVTSEIRVPAAQPADRT